MSKGVNCSEGGAEMENSMYKLENEEKEINTDTTVSKKEETETSHLKNESTTLEEKSKEKEIEAELIKTEKGIQTVMEMEDKHTQTESPQKKDKDDCSPSSLDKLMQDLLQQIECPVCFEYMVPPITLCSNGHNICNTCKQSMRQCPTCRGELLAVRSKCAETLSKSITHPCKFRKSGCTGQFLVEFKEQHEDVCRYGPHKCPLYIIRAGCYWEGPMPEMKQHIVNNHNNIIEHAQGKQTTSNKQFIKYITHGGWKSFVFTLDNVFLYFDAIIDNVLHMCFMFVGSREDTNNYKYTISMRSLDGNKKVTTWDACPNYLDFIEDEFPNEKCAAFYTEFAKQCVRDNDLPYDYEVFQ